MQVALYNKDKSTTLHYVLSNLIKEASIVNLRKQKIKHIFIITQTHKKDVQTSHAKSALIFRKFQLR